MGFKGEIFNTKRDWVLANDKAHNLLKELDNYTSNNYSKPIETIDNKFILVELEGFEAELKGFNFVNLDESIIKIETEI